MHAMMTHGTHQHWSIHTPTMHVSGSDVESDIFLDFDHTILAKMEKSKIFWTPLLKRLALSPLHQPFPVANPILKRCTLSQPCIGSVFGTAQFRTFRLTPLWNWRLLQPSSQRLPLPLPPPLRLHLCNIVSHIAITLHVNAVSTSLIISGYRV
jgi:hypothetical protein